MSYYDIFIGEGNTLEHASEQKEQVWVFGGVKRQLSFMGGCHGEVRGLKRQTDNSVECLQGARVQMCRCL